MPSSTKHNSLGELYLQRVRGRRATPTTVGEMVESWLAHCARTCPSRKGSSTTTNMKDATRTLVGLFAAVPLAELTIDHLEAVRDCMIQFGLARRTINDRMSRLRTMMRHFGPLLDVPGLTLPGLRRGRSKAKETRKKYAVPIRDVLATLKDPYLNPVVKDLCRFQLRVGCRPGEAVRLRGSEIDTTGSPWIARPGSHKGSWRGESERIFAIGPRAQLIVLPHLNDGVIFKVQKHPYVDPPRIGNAYSVSSYSRAISRAAMRQCVPHWTPQQLRKRALTDAPTEELAQKIAGHEDVRTTIKFYRDPVLPGDVAEYAQSHG